LRALVVDGPRDISLRDVARPAADGEFLIRVLRAGICGTDLQLLEGYANFTGIPGHEFVGEIVEVGPNFSSGSPDVGPNFSSGGPDVGPNFSSGGPDVGPNFSSGSPDVGPNFSSGGTAVGARVAGDINVGCQKCDFCARGIKEHCVSRSVLGIIGRNGAFAEYLTLPARNLHVLPDSIDDDTAVFVEPVAAACRILEQVAIARDARVAVLGDGRLGLLIAQVMKTASDDVTVFGRHEEKLDLARSLGLAARHIGDRGADRFDVVVEATGRSTGLSDAIPMTRPRGTIVFKSTFHGDTVATTWPVVVEEITIVGSRCGPFKPAIALLASGAVQVRPLIARVAPLEDYETAFEEARRGLKILFRPGGAAS
jgi:threonine dehydrogenase-like Zn-dependent dehydrogenase